MIVLHQYPPAWGLPSLSPFCVKVETYLRMANLPYEVVAEISPRKGPKGKMPVIVDDGVLIPDSTFIILHLKNKYGDPLDKGLSAVERAIALAFQRLVEENLYWAILYSRWGNEDGWKMVQRDFRKVLPPIVGPLILKRIRKDLLRQAHGHGMGRHTPEEIYAIGRRDLDALAVFLGEKSYFFGNLPMSFDATLYAFIATILHAPIAAPLQECVRSHANLVEYEERMRKTYFASN